jgi:hypothetical protein
MSARRRIAEYGSEQEHREVHRLVLRAVVIVAVTAAGTAWLAAKGPVKVIIGTREIDEIAPTWYMLAAFPVLGMLVADVLDAALECGGVRGGIRGLFAKRTVVLGASVALLVVVSNLRLGIRLPISGHVLLMTYFLALRAGARKISIEPVARPAVVERRIELGVVLALFAAVTAIKLLHWRDWETFGLGVAGGVGLATAVVYFLKTPRTPPATSAVTSRSTVGSESPPGEAR